MLYFYPKDSTPGCTTEACGFREALPDFSKIGAEIIGVSRDSVKRHDSFKAKYELPFTLASDEDGTLCEAYGVWVEKMNYGRKYMGIERSTFLIDEQGRIAKIWRKVRVNKHVEKVLEEARALRHRTGVRPRWRRRRKTFCGQQARPIRPPPPGPWVPTGVAVN